VQLDNHPGEAIIGRHPEHGYIIDGTLRRDCAQVLLELGFTYDIQHEVLKFPAGLSEAEAEDKLARVCLALIQQGHSIQRLGDLAAAELVARASQNTGEHQQPGTQIQAGTARALDDDDEFSLDGGVTWHVCCRGAIGGTIAIYTGEHDGDGEPWTVRIEVDHDDQPCLVRISR
jgi:hypothetical protein